MLANGGQAVNRWERAAGEISRLYPARLVNGLRFWADKIVDYTVQDMHELAVTESIVEIATRHASQAGAERVLAINLVIGELSSIVDDSVQFYFDYLSEGTPVQGAQLVFTRINVELACQACGHRWEPASADWRCPACGAARAHAVQGREFFVESIEVEDQ